MEIPHSDIQEWLDTIEDPAERRAIVAALEIVEPLMVEEGDAEVFTPFVYPH